MQRFDLAKVGVPLQRPRRHAEQCRGFREVEPRFDPVRLPDELAERLEERRLDEPARVVDREIRYTSRYDVGGGEAWSRSFSRASTSALGWSRGAHGLRHSFAQERMAELQRELLFHDALETLARLRRSRDRYRELAARVEAALLGAPVRDNYGGVERRLERALELCGFEMPAASDPDPRIDATVPDSGEAGSRCSSSL